MEQRLSLVTLGVEDMVRARAFYAALGWQAGGPSNDDVTFFQAGGMIVGLYGRAALAADAGIADSPRPAFSGIALAYNARDKAEVDAVLAEAVAVGGRLVKAAEDVFWGGYSGYFADPDGHLWEVAWNPFFPLADDGAISLPD